MTTEVLTTAYNFVDMDCSRSGLNFSTSMGKLLNNDPPSKKTRITRDPMSHRIIEKRRRDRMNNSLADLSQVIPQHYLKQGHGRIEKTEIIEMAIQHIKELKLQIMRSTNDQKCVKESFWLGYKESMDEVMRYLVEIQNYNPSHKLCVDLQKHLSKQSTSYCPDDMKSKDDGLVSTEQESDMIGKNNNSENGASHSSMDMSYSGQPTQEENDSVKGPFRSQSCDDNVYNNKSCVYINLETGNTWPGQQEYSEMTETGVPTLSGFEGTGIDIMKTSGRQWEGRDDNARHSSSVYKFKNDIKHRFNNDHPGSTDKTEPTDMEHSISYLRVKERSYPADPKIMSLKKDKGTMNSPNSESVSSGYQTSEMSSVSGSRNNAENCVEKDSEVRRNRSHKNGRQQSNSGCVPGFALHPGCSYYIPIVINTDQLIPYLRHHDGSPPGYLYHPISIPVNFSGGQFVSVHNGTKIEPIDKF